MPFLPLIIAFKLWMAWDAWRRQENWLWLPIVLLIPGGAVAYLLMVKLRDMEVTEGNTLPEEPTTDLAALRTLVEESPSFANRTRLAWALCEAGEHAEAIPYFEAALSTHANDKDARFGLAAAQLANAEREAAIENLTELVEQALPYDDYAAAKLLASELAEADRLEHALTLMARVYESSHRLEHHLMQAQLQLGANMADAARSTLQQIVERFEALDDEQRHRNGAAATEARRLLRTLEG